MAKALKTEVMLRPQSEGGHLELVAWTHPDCSPALKKKKSISSIAFNKIKIQNYSTYKQGTSQLTQKKTTDINAKVTQMLELIRRDFNRAITNFSKSKGQLLKGMKIESLSKETQYKMETNGNFRTEKIK